MVFHQASITDTTVMDQRKMMHNNVEGFRKLLDLAVKWGSRVVWASSAATYGRGASPNKESQPRRAAQRLRLLEARDGAPGRAATPRASAHPIVGLRYFNVYGAGENHKGKFASMIGQLARQMRAGKRPRIFTDGEQKRDFVYIDDVIAANLAGLDRQDRAASSTSAAAPPPRFNQVVEQLNRVLKTDLQPDYFENPYDFFQTWTEADLTHARKILGYEPQVRSPARH